MSNLQRSPLPFSWLKGTFTISDKSIKQVKLNFFVTTWISSKLNHNEKGHVLPTLIQFHVHRTNNVKVNLKRNSGKCLAPDTQFTVGSWKGPSTCPGLAHTSFLSSWTPAQHCVTAGSYSNACDKLLKKAFLAEVFCASLHFRVATNGVKQNFSVSASTLIYCKNYHTHKYHHARPQPNPN